MSFYLFLGINSGLEERSILTYRIYFWYRKKYKMGEKRLSRIKHRILLPDPDSGLSPTEALFDGKP